MTVAAAGLVAACGLAAPAVAKEGVRATLTTPIPLDAAPGTTLHVGWKLANRDGTPFGGGDIFVRLLSASGDRAETTYTSGGGTFAADVVVPKGGVGDVLIGIRGFSSGPDGTHEAPMFFPISNDPLPGTLHTFSGGDGGSGFGEPWILLLVAGALGAGAVLGRRLLGRRRPRPVFAKRHPAP